MPETPESKKAGNPLLLAPIAWSIFLTIVVLYTDSIPISNYYDVEELFTVNVFLPAIPVLIGIILLQKWIPTAKLIGILTGISLVGLYIAGTINVDFASYNGDALMYHFAYFMIYYRHLFSALLACIVSLTYLTTFDWILKLKAEAENCTFSHIIQTLLKQTLGIAIFTYSELWIAKEYSLGVCFLIGAAALGIGIIQALKHHATQEIQHPRTVESIEMNAREASTEIDEVQDPARFKNFIVLLVVLMLPLIWGFMINVDFFRLTDYKDETDVTMYFTINLRMVVQEIMLGILQFIIIGYVISRVVKSTVWRRIETVEVSEKLERALAFLTLGLTAILVGCLAIGLNPLPIRYVSLFLPWILFSAAAWLVVLFIRQKIENLKVLGLYIGIGALAVWAGIALASEASSNYTAFYFVYILIAALVLLSLVYFVAPRIKHKRSQPTARQQTEQENAKEFHKNQGTKSVSRNPFTKFAHSPKLNRGITALSLIAILCLTFIPVAVVNYRNDGYQLLANVDDQAIFYLVDPTSRVSQDYKPQFGMSMYKNPKGEFAISAARNEYEAVQIVMRPLYQKSFSVYSITFSGFTHVNDPAIGIDSSNFAAYTVEYVPQLSYIVADRLVPFYPRGVSEMVNMPFWLNFYVPAGSEPGDYRGVVTFSVDDRIDPNGWYGRKDIQFNVSLHVYNFSLPAVPTLKSNFGFTADDYYNETMEIFKTHRMMEWAFVDLPKCTLFDNGSVQIINYTDLDAKMTHYHSINTYTVGIHANSYATALPSGEFTVDGVIYTATNYSVSTKYDRTFLEYFDIFEAYLKGKTYTNEFGKTQSWFDEIYINARDEIQNAPEEVKQASIAENKWLKETVRCTIPIMQTVMEDAGGRTDILENVDILCWHTQGYEKTLVTDWKAKGKEVWIYTTCAPRFPAPTMSTAVMALQVRALAWQCFVYNYTHYLIWDVVTPGNGRSGYGYGSWNGGKLFYTAPYGYDQSTRLELIREGFEDYEYFTLLAKTIDKLKATDSNDPRIATGEQMLEQVEALFNDNGYDPNMDYRKFGNLRQQIGSYLEGISVIP